MSIRAGRLIPGLLIGLSVQLGLPSQSARASDESPLAAVRLGRQISAPRPRRQPVTAPRIPARNIAQQSAADADRSATRPEDAAGEARRLNARGVELSLQGKFDQAATQYLQAFEVRRRAFGESDHACAEYLNNLAVTWYRQGQVSRAEPVFQRALTILEATCPESHPDYTTCLQNLALIAADRGRPADGYLISGDVIELVIAGLDDPELMADVGRRPDVLAWHRDCLLSLAHLSAAPPPEVYQLLLMFDQQLLKHACQVGTEGLGRPELQAAASGGDAEDSGSRRSISFSDSPGSRANRRRALASRQQASPVTLRDLRTGLGPSRSLTTLSMDDLAGLVRADSALLDLRAFRQYAPSRAGRPTGEWSNHYVAFIVRHGQPVAAVFLGQSADIDAAALTLDSGADPRAHRLLQHRLWDRVRSPLSGAKQLTVIADGATHHIDWTAFTENRMTVASIDEPSIAVAAGICCFAAVSVNRADP